MAGDPTEGATCERCRARSTFALPNGHPKGVSMSESRAARLTVVSGVLFVVFALIAFLGFTRSGFPDSNDRAIKIAAYFVKHRDAALWQQVFLGLSFLAAAGFVGGVATMLWRVEAARPWAVVAAVGGAAAGGMG